MGCRAKSPADQLLRVVAHEGNVRPDPARRLPGRGAYLHPNAECLAAAERRRAFPRALRVATGLDLADLRGHVHRADELRVIDQATRRIALHPRESLPGAAD